MHKAYIYVDSTDESGQATVAAGVTEVIAAYGVRVLVRATDEQLAALESAGLRVELADEMDSLPFPSAPLERDVPLARESTAKPEGRTRAKSKSKAKTKAKTKGAKKQATKKSAAIPPDTSEEPVYWLVQFVGPPLPEWVDDVRATGAEIVGPIPPNIILVRMTNAQAEAVRTVDRVQWVGPYQPSYKVHPEVLSTPEPQLDAGARSVETAGESVARDVPTSSERVSVAVVLFDASGLESVVAEIEARGGVVEQADMDTIICDLPQSAISNIAALPAVAEISPYVPPTLAMQRARGITNVQPVFDTHGLDGEGEIVCIADTGLDIGVNGPGLHNDFSQLGVAGQFRVRGYGPEQVNPAISAALRRRAPLTNRPLWNDPQGHGTHVSGIAVGNGSFSGAVARPASGVAFKAQLVMQSVLDSAGGLGGIPPNLNRLFETIYTTDEARVHNNSWATAGSFARYGRNAYQIDQFVWRNPDIVIVFAAGNFATDGPRVGPPAPPANPLPVVANGLIDFGSISPQATCRNGITVGGSENTRPGNWAPAADQTWSGKGDAGGNFPRLPIRTDPVANNAQHLMAISSRGPTVSATGAVVVHRIKPDVVAPGSSILSCRSRAVPPPPPARWRVWGVNPPAGYRFGGGTSMAAPHVTGMCALIRQYLRKVHSISDPDNEVRRRRRPSAALIKAFLVHGAQTITGLTQAREGFTPNNHQGWGRVDLRRTLFSLLKSSLANQDSPWLPRRTIFIDDPDWTLNATDRASHVVNVRVADSSVPLRVTLVWTDYPGPVVLTGRVINQLQLQIRQSDGTQTMFSLPAAIRPRGLTPFSNNVQQIDIAAPAPGDYVIQVNATSVPSVAVANVEQDFALVISGAISHSDHRVPGTMAALPDLAFVDLPRVGGNEIHDGLAPSPTRPADSTGSPDIWVSREQNPDEGRAVDHLEVGQTHYVYVRVRNLGFAPANGAQINLYWADMSSPMAYPADWNTEGFRVNGVPGNQRTADIRERFKVGANWQDGEFTVGPFEWTVPRGFERVALFVRAAHPDDPIVNEGDVRWDNNITRRDLVIQDNTTQVQGQPTQFDRLVFFDRTRSLPRDIELRMKLTYEDIRDRQLKPLPAGIEVEVLDYDPGNLDQGLARGRTAVSVDSTGQRLSVLHLTFSTYASEEREPDIYLKVLRPRGTAFTEFLNNSFFASGANSWSSRDQPAATGGFYAENFGGNRIGIPAPVELVIRPAGIRVRAAFEFFSRVSNEFEKVDRGIEVRVKDSNRTAPQPLLARATTDANGEIATILPQRAGYRPSIYFEMEKTAANQLNFLRIDYFAGQNIWDSRTRQAEVIAADNSVSSISGHFQNWAQDRLVAANQRLRFRLESPGILMHLLFQYFDREVTPAPGQYVDLPPGTEVEAREDDLAAVSPLVVGTVGANGRVELSVPKGNRPQLNLFARVVMRRRLTADATEITIPTVEVRKAGSVVQWDTKGKMAIGGASGDFSAVVDHVATAAAPYLFRIGDAADNTDEHAAPFILKVIGQLHDWLRTRSGREWRGISSLHVDLVNDPADGSRFRGNDKTIQLNTAHVVGPPQVVVPILDHRNRAIIAHHYGHLVLEGLFLDPQRTTPTEPNHAAYNPRAEQLNQQRRALAEGWADYIASTNSAPPVQPDSSQPPTGWRGIDRDGANNSGEIVPIAIANTLWQLDRQVVGQGNSNNINHEVNQHRFQALIIRALKALPQVDENRQVAFELYRAIQNANLAPADLIPPHEIAFIRQEVRRIFEANGMVFTRGRFTAAAVRLSPPGAVPLRHRFSVGPADLVRLNIAEMGRVTAYRIQAARAGTFGFVDLDPVVIVADDNVAQTVTIEVNFTAARQTGVLRSAGSYDIRVAARDESGAWDSFADNFTGNTRGPANVTSNNSWQRTRLGSILTAPINVP